MMVDRVCHWFVKCSDYRGDSPICNRDIEELSMGERRELCDEYDTRVKNYISALKERKK